MNQAIKKEGYLNAKVHSISPARRVHFRSTSLARMNAWSFSRTLNIKAWNYYRSLNTKVVKR